MWIRRSAYLLILSSYVYIQSLHPLINRFVIRISGGAGISYNYDYSPLYFMQAACASTSVGDDMKNLAKALYLYGEAAKAYLN